MVTWTENSRITVTEASDFKDIECTNVYRDVFNGMISETFRCRVGDRCFGLTHAYSNKQLLNFSIQGPSVMDIRLSHDEIVHLRAALFSSARYYEAKRKISQVSSEEELLNLKKSITPISKEYDSILERDFYDKSLEFNMSLTSNWAIFDVEDILFEYKEELSSTNRCALERVIERLKELREFQALIGTPTNLREVLNGVETYRDKNREEERE